MYNTRVTNCGVHDFVLEGTAKNGEGIYVGEIFLAIVTMMTMIVTMMRRTTDDEYYI